MQALVDSGLCKFRQGKERRALLTRPRMVAGHLEIAGARSTTKAPDTAAESDMEAQRHDLTRINMRPVLGRIMF
jgi:hypothetical protein